jgi:hypothetical protein
VKVHPPSMGDMTQVIQYSPTVQRLAHDLTDCGPGEPKAEELAEELAGWLAGSARFRTFAEAHRDKIRKKLRTAAGAEALRDVRTELQAARLLLSDRRIALAYEAYGAGKAGPDFTVTLRGERSFNLEVTRPRGAPRATAHGGPLLAKLRQLPPSTPNVVLIAIEGDTAEALDVDAATRALRSRADAKEEAFFAARGFDGTRAFYERYLRLGAVLVWCEAATADARVALWINPSARIALPAVAARACAACLRGA